MSIDNLPPEARREYLLVMRRLQLGFNRAYVLQLIDRLSDRAAALQAALNLDGARAVWGVVEELKKEAEAWKE